jgi:hypothetical protein
MTARVINIHDAKGRLRDGRAVKTEEDFQQWLYEYFDQISRDFGGDHVPSEIFPAIARVMVEWCEAIRGMDPEVDRDTAAALADAVGTLTACLKKGLVAGSAA